MAIDVTVKPLPAPAPEAAPYWDGLRAGRLLMQRCASCERLQFYPRSICRHCLGTDLGWAEMAGTGRIYSFTVIHRAPFEAFKADVPYAYAVVELDEGPRVVATIETDDLDALAIDQPVTAVFDAVTDEVTLLRFRPA
ncbi:Zn-ribbon domain-containing OB-fold protein [Actinomadura sp. 7K534]|uniref:Zn-ribbon domain-containing OB-fold protein n=1 Tax=Actinomadura sp. 7K534 TaxID=2530366 RepID=UPI001051981B|nr:Zn-ribbon domain-containing OB-fold protein [Actinomadura sp. 7K534]TDB95473.1 Zn-ribbon domain-containing OB-fold protein [Actinomadura sp. 7K534]